MAKKRVKKSKKAMHKMPGGMMMSDAEMKKMKRKKDMGMY